MKLRKDNDKVTMMAIVSWWLTNQLQKLKKDRSFEYSIDWMPSDRRLYIRTNMYPGDVKTTIDMTVGFFADGTMLVQIKKDSAWYGEHKEVWENERLTLFDWERIVLYIRGVLEGR